MRKPSKLLSLFLAVVMLLTSLSVGLTALAAEWNTSVTVGTTDVTEAIDKIAHALWGVDGDNGNYSEIATWNGPNYVNTVDNDPNIPGDYKGNHLYDNANGDMYTAVKNAWEVVMNVSGLPGTSTAINTTINNNLINKVRDHMGTEAFNALVNATGIPTSVSAPTANATAAANNNIWFGWFGIGGGVKSTSNGHAAADYNVYVTLDREYYAWNQFKDENGNVDLDSIPNRLITEHTFFWTSSNGGSGSGSSNKSNQVASVADPYDQESDAILVNADELKNFNALFSDGETNYWADFVAGEFDNIPDAVQVAILNGAIDAYDAIQTAEHTELYQPNRGGDTVDRNLTTDHEATQMIFDRYFCTEEELFGENGYESADGGYYYEFLEYLVAKFKNAVNDIEANYFTDSAINSGLTIEELTELMSDIDDAYNIWKGLPASLQPMAQTEKDSLDNFYYNDTDTGANITSFVPAWNTANAQAYIDAVEELEFASGYVDGTFVKEYVIESKAEADKTKALLDAADEAFGNFLWEASYADTATKEGKPGIDNITVLGNDLKYVSPENGYTVNGGDTVFDYANKVYRQAFLAYYEYLYRQFMQIAPPNLDEYVVDADNNGITLNDQIVIPVLTVLDVVAVSAKISKVNAAYEPLVQEFRDRDWVKFYMNIVRELEAALKALQDSGQDWAPYEPEYPYYYNWDKKDKTEDTEADTQALLDALNDLLGSDQVASILGADSIADFAGDTIEGLLTGESADGLIKNVLAMVMPMLQDAMEDAKIDVNVDINTSMSVLGVNATITGTVEAKDDILNIVRNDGVVFAGQLKATALGGIVNINPDLYIYAEVLFPDPDMLYDHVAKFAQDQDSKDMAKRIGDSFGLVWPKADDDSAWDSVGSWNIKTVDEFCNVMGGILDCMAKLVRSLLFNEKAEATVWGEAIACGQTIDVADTINENLTDVDLKINAYYNAGYEKDILPFLELLGCTGLTDSETLTQMADNNDWANVLKAIVNPLLDRVYRSDDSILQGNILTNILGLLPNLAYLITWDKIAGDYPEWNYIEGTPESPKTVEAKKGFAGLNDLLAPLTELADLSLAGFGIDALDGSFIMDIINGMLADTGIVLPDINWAMIAGAGTMKDDVYSLRDGNVRKSIVDVDFAKIVNFLIYYITQVITENQVAIHDLIAKNLPEGNESVANLFEQLYSNFVATAKDPQAFGAVIFELLRAVEDMPTDWADPATWEIVDSILTDDDYAKTDYTKQEVTDSIDTLAAIAKNALDAFVFVDDVETLTDFISSLDAIKEVLNGDIINKLFKTIYSLDSEMIRTILGLIMVTDGNGDDHNIDISIETISATLEAAGYSDVAKALEDWANEGNKYFVVDVETGEYEITCHYKENDEAEECGTKIKVTDTAGTVACPECENDVAYTADDVKALTEKKSVFDDEEAITADMWNVEDIDSFKTALVTILDPFKYVVGTLLAGEGYTLSIAELAKVSGNNAYENIIKPLFSVFEDEDDDGFKFKDIAIDNAFEEVITIALDLINAIAADPVNKLIGALPQIAAFIDNGGIQSLVTYVLYPLWNVLSAALDLFQIDNDIVPETDSNRIFKDNDSLFELIDSFIPDDSPFKGLLPDFDNLQDNLFDIVNNFLINIIEDKYSIVIPAIDWADLAGSGTLEGKTIVADKESVVVKILRYIWRVVYTNEDTIFGLLEEKVGDVFAVLEKYGIILKDYSEDDFVFLVLTLINGLDSSDYDSIAEGNWDWVLDSALDRTIVDYPEGYGYEDVDDLLAFISGAALNAVEQFVKGFKVTELGATIYNSAIPVLLAENILPLLESQKDIFSLLGIEYGYADLIADLAEYPDVVAAIEAQGVDTLAAIDWSAIANDNLFGIEDSGSFCNAVVTVLDPISDLLGFILNAGTINVLGVVPLTGAYGYRNAVLPLLTALGIDGVVDADTYAAAAEEDSKNILANIINPLFAWVDGALDFSEGTANAAAGTLLSLLPNLANFLNNGGLQQFLHDLLYPAVHLVNTIIYILTTHEQDSAFDIAFDIAYGMLSGSSNEDKNILDTLLDAIFGGKSTNAITWSNAHEHIFELGALVVNNLIDGASASVDENGNLVLNISVSGNPMTIVVPKLDLAEIAGLGLDVDQTEKATDTLLYIWQYIWDGVLNNATTFKSVTNLLANELDFYSTEVGGYPVGAYIESLLSSTANEMMAAFIQMVDALDTSDYDVSADFDELFATMFNGLSGLAATEYPGLQVADKNSPDYYYDENDIKDILDTFTSLVNAIVSIASGYETDEIAEAYIFTDDIAELVADLVASIAENPTLKVVLPMLGVDFSKEAFAAKLTKYGYTELAAAVTKAAKLSDVDWAGKWYVSNESGFASKVNATELAGDNTAQYRFARALTVMLSPFSELLNAMMNGKQIKLADVLDFAGPLSYNNAIKPLLDAFGCDAVEIADFAAQTADNADYFLFNILNPILGQVDKLIADPTNTLLASLPTLAAFVNSSGLEKAIKNLLYPVEQLINPLFRLALPDGMTEDNAKASVYDVALAILGFNFKFEDLHDNIFDIIAKLVNGDKKPEIITIDAKGSLVINITINGNKYPLVIPQYALDKIAGCGVSENETKKVSDTFVTIFRYFTKILRVNADDFILPVLEGVINDADIFTVVKKYLSNVIKPEVEDAVLITLIRVIKNLETADLNTDALWAEIGKLPEGVDDVDYAPQTLGTITQAIETLSKTAKSALEVFAGIDIANLTVDMLYNGSLISTLASVILPLGDNNTIKVIFKEFLGVDLDKASVAAHLKELGYADIANAITKAKTMADVNWAGLESKWNVADAESFSKALVAILSPFADLIGVLLLPDNTINIADGTFEIDGAFGYRNAIKPLLEALGVDTVDCDTYVEMAKADSDNILFNIIYPLLARIDAILADPVGEFLLTLPTLANYLEDGGLQLTIQNLLYPLINPLDPVVRLLVGDIKGEDEIKPEEFYDIIIDIVLGDYKDKFSWAELHNQIYEVAAIVIDKYVSGLTAKVNKDGSLTIFDLVKFDENGRTVSYAITIPAIGGILDKLANCGNPLDLAEYAANYDTGNKTDATIKANTFVALIQILWDIADSNEYSIKGIVKHLTGNDTYSNVEKYVNRLFDNEGKDLVNAVVAVINSIDASGYDSSKIWKVLLSQKFDPTVASYPAGGYNASDINFVIDTVSEILTNVLEEFANIQLADLANGYIYKDSYISAIAKIIVDLGANDSISGILKFIGVDLSKDAIANALKAAGFEAAAKAIKADKIDWNSISWKADTKAGFVKALTAVISPLETILAYVLTAGEINIGDVLPIKGANGYDNAVKHLLEEAFGCTGLVASSGYSSASEIVGACLNAILTKVESILKSDNLVGTLLDALPQLSAFIARGGVQQFVEDLLYPVTNFVNPIVALVFDGNLFEFAIDVLKSFGILEFDVNWKTVHNDLIDVINSFLNFTIKDGNYTITLNKDLTWAKLAGCATRPDTLLTILSYIWSNVQSNRDAVEGILKALLGDDTYANVAEYVNKFLSNADTDLAQAIVDVLRGFDASAHKADWSFLTKGYKSQSPKYPDGVTAKEVDEMIKSIAKMAENALQEFILKGDFASLAEFVGSKLYTQDLINTIQNAINSLAKNDTVKTVLDLVGVELSENTKSYTVTGKLTFINALVDILKPFESLITAFLNAGDIEIAGVVTLTSADIFNNAVKPLLEYAFGVQGLNDGSLKGIITALLNRVDQILDNPVEEALGLIPMLANFINKGGIQYFVEELLYPVLNMAAPILSLVTDKSIFEFAFDLLGVESKLGVQGVTWDNIHTQIPAIANGFLKDIKIGDGKYSFTLNSLDLAALAACGKANGLNVIGNNADTFVTLFNIIWNIIKENRAAIDSILDNVLSDSLKNTIGEYINNILNKEGTDIVKAMVKLFRGFNASQHKADWSFLFKNYKTTTVKYPEGVTAEDIEEIIDILTVAIENALSIFLDTSLTTLASDLIYTDSIINAVQKVINSLAGNDTVKTVFGLLGLEINANNKTYKVTDKASFAAALADVLAPFEPIIDAFLNKGDITIADVVTITGADGFNNAVKPLLEYALGCYNVQDSSLKGIITAILDRVDEILESPIEELVDLLPMISNFIGKGGVQYFVEELFYPVLNIADAVLELITDENLFDFAFSLLGVDLTWSNAQNEVVPLLNSMLKNVTINGKSYSITIPEIDWSKLGGCGKLRGTSIFANQGDAVMTLLEYIFKALEANKGIIYDLVGDNATINQIITNVLNQGAGGMVKIFVRILLKMETFDNVEWFFKNIAHVDTTYTASYDRDDYAGFVEDIDAAIFGMLAEFVPDLNVTTLLSNMVYKNSIVNSVAKLVYTNLDRDLGGLSLAQILKAIDLDITTSGVAEMLSDFASASAEIGKHDSWHDVDFNAINWNFEDGDKTGFINALSAALRPIQPIIRVILSGEDLIVLGSIHIKGGDGYNTTVIPLLEALGVSPADLVSPQQYAAEGNTDKVLTSVLTPVLDLAETLLNTPIKSISEMLPNLAYFLLNGHAENLVRNIAGPVFNILEEVAPIYDLDVDQLLLDNVGFGISSLGDLDLDELVNGLLGSIRINGQELGIQITDIDLETLAGRGELVTYRSARTYDGKQMDAKKVIADTPAVFLSVLRYIVENLKANLDAIKALLAGIGIPDNIAGMVETILGFLTDLDTDAVIEELLALLFGTSDGDGEGNNGTGNAPYEVKDLGWLHWTIVGGATLFMLLIFIALLGKKKKEEKPETADVAANE